MDLTRTRRNNVRKRNSDKAFKSTKLIFKSHYILWTLSGTVLKLHGYVQDTILWCVLNFVLICHTVEKILQLMQISKWWTGQSSWQNHNHTIQHNPRNPLRRKSLASAGTPPKIPCSPVLFSSGRWTRSKCCWLMGCSHTTHFQTSLW